MQEPVGRAFRASNPKRICSQKPFLRRWCKDAPTIPCTVQERLGRAFSHQAGPGGGRPGTLHRGPARRVSAAPFRCGGGQCGGAEARTAEGELDSAAVKASEFLTALGPFKLKDTFLSFLLQLEGGRQFVDSLRLAPLDG